MVACDSSALGLDAPASTHPGWEKLGSDEKALIVSAYT